MNYRKDQFMRASEVGEYVFCARAWRLRLEGNEPIMGQVKRVAGQQWHRQHGKSVRRVKILKKLVGLCSLSALLLLILVVVYWLLK
jgi:hypothetical protein